MKFGIAIILVLLGLTSNNKSSRPVDNSYPEWSKNFNDHATQESDSCQTHAVFNSLHVCLTYNDENFKERLDPEDYFETCIKGQVGKLFEAVLNVMKKNPPKTKKPSVKIVSFNSLPQCKKYRKEKLLGNLSIGTYDPIPKKDLIIFLNDSLQKGPVLTSINSRNLNYEMLFKRKSRDFNSPLVEKDKRYCQENINIDDHNHDILILNFHHFHDRTNEQLFEILDSNLKFTYFLTREELEKYALHNLCQIDCSQVNVKEAPEKKMRKRLSALSFKKHHK